MNSKTNPGEQPIKLYSPMLAAQIEPDQIDWDVISVCRVSRLITGNCGKSHAIDSARWLWRNQSSSMMFVAKRVRVRQKLQRNAGKPFPAVDRDAGLWILMTNGHL